jgi:hypothetical protein
MQAWGQCYSMEADEMVLTRFIIIQLNHNQLGQVRSEVN